MIITKEKLLSFTSKSGLYSVEESGGRLTLKFSSVILEEVLGEYSEITISGRVLGEKIDIDKVVILRPGYREEVDPGVLEGWLRYIEQTEKVTNKP
ncbi:MAG: hypothetical protein ACP5II_02710 [Infirmifilum sp.]|jgi:hypothetical protein|uniref:Uncharacterized protein n=1 Tax=Infirmifilum uzonense TaxID=1550241 RepID=A0A0F7FIN7_9CREN|nr:hypothetical protein [Infirmifilum uzonense]AKG38688.1 hypothetical protein MA03_04515 [Infirmifilum uzonense]